MVLLVARHTRRLAVCVVFAWVLTALSGTPALAHHEVDFWFGPPARAADSSTTANTARLTDDWHCSELSGDPYSRSECASRSGSDGCVPEEFGQATCSALDWHDGAGAAGDNAYFRGWGHWDGGGTRTSTSKASVSLTSGTSGCGGSTVHWLKAAVKDQSGTTKGTMVYQHISKLSGLSSFALTVGGGSAGTFNNKHIGDMVDDFPHCGTGFHVHEDDDRASAWYGWNTSVFTNTDGSSHQVDNKSKWTRKIKWTAGTHNVAPSASISVSPTIGDTNTSFSATVSGSDPEGDALTYKIDWGDGSSTNAKTGTHRYTTPGDYTVTGTATDVFGAKDTASRAVTVCALVINGVCL